VGGPGDQAGYGGDEARGWDECFPTISAGHDPVWGISRDHGALWGRPWQVTHHPDPQHCTTTFRSPLFCFKRSLTLDGAMLHVGYSVTSRALVQLPYLWSQHALLATTPQDRLELNGISELVTGADRYTWPDHPARNLKQVGPLQAGFMQKSYAATPNGAGAEVHGPDGGLRFDWSADVPGFGLWLDYGGWPAQVPVHQIAFEPTTALADDIPRAHNTGQTRLLDPGAAHSWAVRITLTGQSRPISPALGSDTAP